MQKMVELFDMKVENGCWLMNVQAFERTEG